MTKTKYISANEWFTEYYQPLVSFWQSNGTINGDIFFDNLEGRCVDILHALLTKVDIEEEHWGGASHSDWTMDYAEAVVFYCDKIRNSKWFGNGGVALPTKPKKSKKPTKKKKSTKSTKKGKGKK